MPSNWRVRAVELRLSSPDVTCLCPDASDIALAKACAWREKDRSWLRSAVLGGIVDLEAMKARVDLIGNRNAPTATEIRRRIDMLAASLGQDPSTLGLD